MNTNYILTGILGGAATAYMWLVGAPPLLAVMFGCLFGMGIYFIEARR